jgi:tRNA threonylcarbamoyladenosine biosynthesis protein TsaB
MALILNIETSTEVCSVLLAENGKLVYEKESTEGMNHSRLLTVFIEELFAESKTIMKKLDAVAVSKGPGSYTGLRIGVSVAKGLCYSLGIPLIAVGSLDAMAYYASQSENLPAGLDADENLLFCPMIDARRMEVYTALYNKNGENVQPVSAEIIDENSFSALLENKKIILMGNGAQKCKDHLLHPNFLYHGPFQTSARFMQIPAEKKFEKNEFEDVAYFEPFYLKNFVATIPKNKILE